MVNAWSLADSVLNGTLDEDYPIMYGPDDEANAVKWRREKLDKDPEFIKWREQNPDKSDYYFDYDRNDPDMPKPFGKDANLDLAMNDDQIAHHISAVKGGMGDDHLSFSLSDDPYPTVSAYQYHYPPMTEKPKPDLDNPVVRKYQEDKGIKDLTDYIASTYSGHYTNKGSNVQTLDLIQSVGDAESFCRSNAIKYLSRYDKRGQAKRDILKAMHYCLLLYYFSGNTNNETPTRGYETF